MKRKEFTHRIFLFFLPFILTFMVGCNKESDSDYNSKDEIVNEPHLKSLQIIPGSTFKYFGYFHADGFNGSGSFYDQIASLNNSNILMINSAWTAAQTVTALNAVQAKGMKAFLSVFDDFFTGGTVSVMNSAVLRSDYLAAWNTRCGAIENYIQNGTLLGVYFDEPAWQGANQVDFRLVTNLIHTQYPNLRILHCMTTADIGGIQIPNYTEVSAAYNEYCTDVTYDDYSTWNDNIRAEYLNKLKSKATNGQAIWGVVKGCTQSPSAPSSIQDMIANLYGFYRQALSEPRYVGLISFSFATYLADSNWGVGLTSFFNSNSQYYSQELLGWYIDIGRSIVSKQIASGNYIISNRYSGFVMDAYDNRTADGTSIIQWSPNGGSNQIWNVTNIGNGQYSIVGVQSNKPISVNNDGKLILNTWSSTDNQKWVISPTTNGYYTLTSVQSGNLMETPGTVKGSNLQVATTNGTLNQEWTFTLP